MFSFQKHSLLLARRLDIIAALAIFAMMALTSVDIFLRYFFRKPIPGTYEIVALLGAVAVSFAMAHTLAVKGHVAVSLIVQMFPKRLQGIVESFISIFGIILYLVWCGLPKVRGGFYDLAAAFLSNHIRSGPGCSGCLSGPYCRSSKRYL
ncbi:MAG: hypothetical protein B6I32_05735 [Desulfobacterium sp. 4572_20]|nr:MAG: hypothetical protein B6I32_05735 [Desulfobacterium sp. 4572_20]